MRPRVRCSTPRRPQLPPQLGTPADTTPVATLARSDSRRGVTGTRGTHLSPRKDLADCLKRAGSFFDDFSCFKLQLHSKFDRLLGRGCPNAADHASKDRDNLARLLVQMS